MKKLELSIPKATTAEMRDDESIIHFRVSVLKEGGGKLRWINLDVSYWESKEIKLEDKAEAS